MRRLFAFVILILIFKSCSWDNEETLYPGPEECDTTNVSYTTDIVPILSGYCYSCHSNLDPCSILKFEAWVAEGSPDKGHLIRTTCLNTITSPASIFSR